MVDTSLSPYFDDYNEDKNYHKVLFTPRRSVQVRELNQLQTMLQDQVSRFGSHVFENGSMVIPGELNYDLSLEYVTLNALDFENVEEILLTNEVRMVGQTTGVTARVVDYFDATEDDPITFYVQYESSNGETVPRFAIGEHIALVTDLGVNVASPVVESTGQGSVLTIEAGVFFINGNFVRTDAQRVILSKYSSMPSVTAGFKLIESAVTWSQDPSLLDNAAGTTNQNAIGADRLKLELKLEVHNNSEEFDRTDFIELVRFREGHLQRKVRGPDYNILEDVLARRTYDESGDYTVNRFGISIENHQKIFPTNPDDTKFVVGLEPGKAYVRGYEVYNDTTEYVEVDKARDFGRINNSSFTLPVGNYIAVTGMNILPKSNSFQKITFYSGTPSSAGAVPTGTVLGSARVRYAEFSASVGYLFLFDVRDATGRTNSSFVDAAKSVYAAGTPSFTAIIGSELIDSLNYGFLFKLPVSNVKSLLTEGVSDTSFSVTRQYEVTADTSGTVVLTAGSNEVFATPSGSGAVASYTVSGSNTTTRDISSISTLGGIPVGKTLTIAFGSGAASKAVTINVEVIKQVGTHKAKVPTAHTVTLAPGVMNNRRFNLGKADAFKLIRVTDVATGIDRTSAYTLNRNSTLEYYGVSFIELSASESVPTGDTRIEFEYFLHGTGDYFSVDSYSGIDYAEIPSEVINNRVVPLSDVVDFRPRLSDDGSGFSGTGASYVEAPTQYSLFRCDIEHYLPRIDKVFVTAKGVFGVKKGVSATEPKEPETPSNTMVLYHLHVPAYTKDVKDISAIALNNRRYTMRDIGKLENRIANVEYYTTLSLLESETAALQIIDPATGLNRFKNGFIVDNFVDHTVGSFTLNEYRCSISAEDKTLRPEFYAEEVDFEFDQSTSTGVVKTGGLVTLPYTEVEFLNQNMATGYMNVNPYAVYRWNGTVDLTPSSDIWFDTVYTTPSVTIVSANNANQQQQWNSWETNWAGSTTIGSGFTRVDPNAPAPVIGSGFRRVDPATVQTTNEVVEDRVVSTAVIPFMRSRNVAFSGKGLMPQSRVYAIFDNIEVSAHCRQDGKTLGAPMFTDVDGNINGIFVIPNTPNLRFRCGTKKFTLIDNPEGIRETSLSYGATDYTAQGTLVTRTQTIISTRTVAPVTAPVDPLAQSFYVEKAGGVFLTSVDLYFASKDKVTPVTIQIRNMENGMPGTEVVPYSSLVIKPSEVKVSSDASAVTRFTFESPVYLSDGNEYCFVVMSNSNDYNVFIATMGKKSVDSNAYVSKQPYVGVMFKSQNNSTWTPDQESDMKFKMNIAKFDTEVEGVASFHNVHSTPIFLENNPFVSTTGSNVVTVNLSNHGMFVGSKFEVKGAGIAQGIPAEELNAVHTVTEIVDADTLKIAVSSNASATGRFGGDVVECDRNVLGNVVQPIVQELLFENTNVDWTFAGTTGKSIHGAEIPYISSNQMNITPNQNNPLSAPIVIPSATDANDKLSGPAGRMRARMVTFQDNVSPVIDTNRLGLVCVSNRINNPTPLLETDANGGNAIARYITNVVGLKNAASSLKVFVDVNRPQGADVKLYFRIGNTDAEVADKNWALMDAVVSTVATDQFSFAEFEYAKEELSLFTFYQFKIVMTSDSSSNAPRLKHFRGIALGS